MWIDRVNSRIIFQTTRVTLESERPRSGKLIIRVQTAWVRQDPNAVIVLAPLQQFGPLSVKGPPLFVCL